MGEKRKKGGVDILFIKFLTYFTVLIIIIVLILGWRKRRTTSTSANLETSSVEIFNQSWMQFADHSKTNDESAF